VGRGGGACTRPSRPSSSSWEEEEEEEEEGRACASASVLTDGRIRGGGQRTISWGGVGGGHLWRGNRESKLDVKPSRDLHASRFFNVVVGRSHPAARRSVALIAARGTRGFSSTLLFACKYGVTGAFPQRRGTKKLWCNDTTRLATQMMTAELDGVSPDIMWTTGARGRGLIAAGHATRTQAVPASTHAFP
jgi:hypothetical protein